MSNKNYSIAIDGMGGDNSPDKVIEGCEIFLNDNNLLITSLTTILVLLALFFVGGQLIHGFATALLFGVIVGTYSSIFVASSVALTLGVSRDDLMPTEVEKEVLVYLYQGS